MTAAVAAIAGPVPEGEGMLAKPFELSALLAEAERFCGRASWAGAASP
jgi:hypothetical protein